MSQSQNKFIIGYSVVTLIGAGILGYLCYSAYSSFDESESKLKGDQVALENLQKAALYPKQENVDAKRKQVDAFVAEVNKLHSSLVAYQSPLDYEIPGDKVSEKLGEFKARLELTAKSRKIELPKDFSLGLARYLTGAPLKEAAPQVNYLATSVDTLLTILVNNGVTKINEVQCPEMPYEKDTTPPPVDPKKKKPATPPSPAPAPAPVKSTKPTPKSDPTALDETRVLSRYKINLQFTGSEKSVQACLNQIASMPEGGPFFAVNLMRIENESHQGPSKAFNITPSPVPPDAADPVAPDSSALIDSKYIIGNEKISVFMDIDVLRFKDLEGAADSEAPPAVK